MAVFNEDTRVKIPATIQFLRLDYNHQSLKAADIDIDLRTEKADILFSALMIRQRML